MRSLTIAAVDGFVDLFLRVAGPNPIWQGLWGGLVITTFNLVGALAVLVWRNPKQRALDATERVQLHDYLERVLHTLRD